MQRIAEEGTASIVILRPEETPRDLMDAVQSISQPDGRRARARRREGAAHLRHRRADPARPRRARACACCRRRSRCTACRASIWKWSSTSMAEQLARPTAARLDREHAAILRRLSGRASPAVPHGLHQDPRRRSASVASCASRSSRRASTTSSSTSWCAARSTRCAPWRERQADRDRARARARSTCRWSRASWR